MLNLLANINPADIVAFARTIPLPGTFELTQRVVPNRNINNVRYKIKSTENRFNAAKFRAYDAETPFGRREVTHQTLEGMLPPVGDKYLIGELEEILLQMDRGADDSALVDALYDDAERAVRAIFARMELAAGDLLEDRIFTLNDENGLTLEGDFGATLDATWTPTAGVFWDDPTAPALDDEQAWIRQLRTDGDGAPAEVLTSDRALSVLAQNEQYKGSFYGDNASAATRPTLNPQQINSVRATYNLPPVNLYDATVRVDSVNVRPIDEGKWILLPADKASFAETQYGITAEALALSRGSGNPRIEREDLPGVVVTVKEDDDPVRVTTKGAAVAMPVMYAPKSYIPAQVLAPTP